MVRRRPLVPLVVVAALAGTGITGCSHSSSGTSTPSTTAGSGHPSASPTTGQHTPQSSPGAKSTTPDDPLLQAVQGADKPAGGTTRFLGSGTGTQALDITDTGGNSFHIDVSCVGGLAAFNSGGTKFFQTSQCGGQGVVYSADVPARYLRSGHITIVAPSGTKWAVEITST